jgi:malonyl-CoA O-methyltransferase
MTLSFKKKIMRDFNRAAKTYDTFAALQRKVSERLFNIQSLQNQLTKAQIGQERRTILEIGCGTGYFHELLRKNKIYLPLIQIDIAPAMCEIAASYASPPEYGRTHTCAADMHHLPFADNSFNIIFSSMTMQWAENIEQVFIEAKRVLSNGGDFAFSIVGNDSLFELQQSFLLANLSSPIHSFSSQNEIKEKLIQAGLAESEVFTETITMFYDDIYSLLRAIKNVGASYKNNNQKGLLGKKHFEKVEKIYHSKFATPKGLPLSWNIIYIKGRK